MPPTRTRTPTRTPTLTTPTRTPTRTTPSEHALARCIEPVGAEDFFGRYWERRPLSVPRREPGRFDDLLSGADVERLVCSTGIPEPAFRLVRAGAPPPGHTVDVPWRPVAFSATADVPRVLAEFE